VRLEILILGLSEEFYRVTWSSTLKEYEEAYNGMREGKYEGKVRFK
jgi:hypothetical protein